MPVCFRLTAVTNGVHASARSANTVGRVPCRQLIRLVVDVGLDRVEPASSRVRSASLPSANEIWFLTSRPRDDQPEAEKTICLPFVVGQAQKSLFVRNFMNRPDAVAGGSQSRWQVREVLIAPGHWYEAGLRLPRIGTLQLGEQRHAPRPVAATCATCFLIPSLLPLEAETPDPDPSRSVRRRRSAMI